MRIALALLSLSFLFPAGLSAEQAWQSHGAQVAPGKFRSIERVVKRAEKWDGKRLRVEGQVASVCKKKGCWMELKAGDDMVRVTFKDYGFFVPLDCEGATVRVDGVFRLRSVPVDEARHYLEDAGKHEEAAKITKPVMTYEIVADGVLLQPASSQG